MLLYGFRCPLYSDTNELHKTAVIKGAEQAKAEIGITNDPTKLKIDPTADLHQHYKNKSHKGYHGHPIEIHGLGHLVRNLTLNCIVVFYSICSAHRALTSIDLPKKFAKINVLLLYFLKTEQNEYNRILITGIHYRNFSDLALNLMFSVKVFKLH